jgi:predicted acyltransferase
MPAPATRLRSVDAFRGLTMAGMVIVNNPGDWNTVYPPLLHAEWHGWTPTDLIFPWFLVVMGVAMALAGPERAPWPAVLRRTAIIVGLGLALSGFPYFNPAHWRIPGVLVRIGLCYLTATLVWRSLAMPDDPTATIRRLAVATAALLLAYWALLALVPPPGGVAGDLAPGRDLGAWLDRTLLGGHLWKADWDPEGLLSTLPAVGSTLLGVIAGTWMKTASPARATGALVAGGVALIAAGLAWGLVFPINKSLWTSSYVLFTAGAAAVVLAVLHRALDGGRASPRAVAVSEPLVALGRNALLLFVLSGLVGRLLILVQASDRAGGRVSLQQAIYRTVFVPLAAPRVASLLYALTCLALLYALLAWLHRRRWYWSA